MASEDGNSQPKEQSRGGGLLQAWIHSASEGVEAKSVKTFSAVVFPANPCNDFRIEIEGSTSDWPQNPGKFDTRETVTRVKNFSTYLGFKLLVLSLASEPQPEWTGLNDMN